MVGVIIVGFVCEIVGEPPVRGRPFKHTYSIKLGLVSN